MPVIKITKTNVDRIPLPPTGQVLYLDEELKGFGVLVSRSAKTYVAQRDIHGRTKRLTVGRHGVVNVYQAREEARQLIAQMARGLDPTAVKKAERAKKITLRAALQSYLDARKTLKAKSREGYRAAVETYLHAWLDRPLADITRDGVAERHVAIQEEVAARKRSHLAKGHYAANGAFVALRAIWNHAKELNPALPDNPVQRLSRTRAWFPTKRRTGIVKPSDMPAWYAAVFALPNQAQRDFILLLLFTGMRRGEASTLRWENIDLRNGTLKVPETKSGRPLDLPLSDYLIDLLRNRKAYAGESAWVFPSLTSTSGHIEEPRPGLDAVAEATGVSVTPHDIRRTFITIAEGCDISAYALKALVNHSMGGDVTAGYIVSNVERLRNPMQLVTRRILEIARERETESGSL